MEEIKRCTKCGEIWPKTNEFFGRHKATKDGFATECKKCRDKYAKEYRAVNGDKSKCKRRIYYSNNRVAFAEKSKKRYSEDPQKYKDMGRRWERNNPEKVAAKKKRYNEAHPDRIVVYRKKYSKEHPEIFRIRRHKRAAIEKELPSTLTRIQWEDIKIVFNNCCAYCGKEKPLEQDHFVALIKNGENSHNNIIPACKSCNCSKGAKLFSEWYPKFKHYSKKRERIILDHLNYDNGIQQLSFV